MKQKRIELLCGEYHIVNICVKRILRQTTGNKEDNGMQKEMNDTCVYTSPQFWSVYFISAFSIDILFLDNSRR